jgi:hypothetical protein
MFSDHEFERSDFDYSKHSKAEFLEFLLTELFAEEAKKQKEGG